MHIFEECGWTKEAKKVEEIIKREAPIHYKCGKSTENKEIKEDRRYQMVSHSQ